VGGLGGALDFLTVLVGAGEEPRVNAEGTFAAGNGVGDDGGVGVADVRARVDVINRGGEVELLGVGHMGEHTASEKPGNCELNSRPTLFSS